MDQPNVFSGTLVPAPSGAGVALRWLDGVVLELGAAPTAGPGAAVEWMIPADSIIVHRRDRPSRGERENPVDATLLDQIPLGDMTRLVMAARADPGVVLTTQVPTHVVRRNRYQPGGPVRVSLRADAIHVFPVPPSSAAET